MSPLSARRILTALTLAILLCAAPALAQAPARAVRTAHAVAAPTQLGVLDVFQNAIAHFIAKITTSHGGSGGGVVAGPRIDPEGGGPTGNPPVVGTP
jgi:hypothetical protein